MRTRKLCLALAILSAGALSASAENIGKSKVPYKTPAAGDGASAIINNNTFTVPSSRKAPPEKITGVVTGKGSTRYGTGGSWQRHGHGNMHGSSSPPKATLTAVQPGLRPAAMPKLTSRISRY